MRTRTLEKIMDNAGLTLMRTTHVLMTFMRTRIHVQRARFRVNELEEEGKNKAILDISNPTRILDYVSKVLPSPVYTKATRPLVKLPAIHTKRKWKLPVITNSSILKLIRQL